MTQLQKDIIFENSRFVNMTINGEPAVLCGRLLDFPVVRSLDGVYHAAFAWKTVERILANGGDFEM